MSASPAAQRPSRDLLVVDLHGCKAALAEHAAARGVTTSELVRGTLISLLGGAEPRAAPPVPWRAPGRLSDCATDRVSDRVRLSLRLSRRDADRLAQAARHAGLPIGAYLAGLAASIPALTPGPASGLQRADLIAALVAASAELSAFNRSLHHLTALLRDGEFAIAQTYRETLDTLAGAVHRHLRQMSAALAELQPNPRPASRRQPPRP